jgi:hypothetical protein
MFKKQGTSKRSASTSIGDIKPGFHEATPTDMGSQASACDMGWAFEELEHCEELSEVQLATVVGGGGTSGWDNDAIGSGGWDNDAIGSGGWGNDIGTSGWDNDFGGSGGWDND